MACKNRILSNIAEQREYCLFESMLPHPLGVWYFRFIERRALRQAGPEQLADAGIGRDEALREAEKPFWRC